MSENSNITPKTVIKLVEDQNYKCALSGRTLTPSNASLDHIQPLARGGKHHLKNLWVLHRDVNTAKGTLEAEDFISICKAVARHCKSCNGNALQKHECKDALREIP